MEWLNVVPCNVVFVAVRGLGIVHMKQEYIENMCNTILVNNQMNGCQAANLMRKLLGNFERV